LGRQGLKFGEIISFINELFNDELQAEKSGSHYQSYFRSTFSPDSRYCFGFVFIKHLRQVDQNILFAIFLARYQFFSRLAICYDMLKESRNFWGHQPI
jgi:hypothetical protein